MPSRNQKKRSKQRAEYLQKQDENKAKARVLYKANPEKMKASVRDSYKANNESKRTLRRTALLIGGGMKRTLRETALLKGRNTRTIQLPLKHLKGVCIGMTLLSDWLNVLPRGRGTAGVTELPKGMLLWHVVLTLKSCACNICTA